MIMQQGAEAIIFLEKNIIKKQRVKKNYRVKKLDRNLRKKRTKSEARIISRLRNIIPVPKILETDNQEIISMEYINGKKLSENLEKLNWKNICKNIGQNISKLHDQNIIHGDLTTSNMILKNNQVYFIDFGLAFHSYKIEDKAVDLHLLKQALGAKHFKIAYKATEIILKNYKSRDYKKILGRLNTVESRGRYKKH
ncbi:Kae1-associated serine/threonine protein kinase [Candidatus Pacearchaeota archaeon]|nr:Kae1-associated serine/threonine protein kinase [Candidatus Pacearchaeota archaeon]MBD3282668.1 Kae1-associated serine/threonine protein kinase [Candidatus Pacearchaeota archaeon]